MCKITHCTFHYTLCKITHCERLHTMCGIRLYRGPCRVQYGKIEKFYTHIVADVADYYEVCSQREEK